MPDGLCDMSAISHQTMQIGFPPISQPTLKIPLCHTDGKPYNVHHSSEFIKTSHSLYLKSFSFAKLTQNTIMENDQVCPFFE